MKNYRYSLDKSSKKYICPECGRKTFVLYVDNHTGSPLHSTAGKCDRADNCGYHYPPKEYFTDNRIPFSSNTKYAPRPRPQPKPQPSFINIGVMKKSLSNYEKNKFVQWLIGIVGEKQASEAIGRYFVGTLLNGGTCFWQIDLQGKVRTGKIIMYGEDGHRRKDVTPPVQWVHSPLKPNFILSQCFFGEHLLYDATKKVAVVESEKTAVIASIYLPDMIWLACGGSEGLSSDRCSVLRGRNVVLFPDSGQYDKWSAKAKELSRICTASVSSLIEQQATEQERGAGFDIADYLIRFSPQQF